MSKLYTGKAYFQKSTFELLNPILTKPVTMRVRNIIGGGDQPWAVAELMADSVCKNGMAYDQVYSWVCRSVLLLALPLIPFTSQPGRVSDYTTLIGLTKRA